MQKPTGHPPWAGRLALLLVLLLAATADADFGDLLVVGVGDDPGSDALFSDLGEHLVLQAAFQSITGLELLGVLIKLVLHHLDAFGYRESLLRAFLALALVLGKGDLAAIHLGDDRSDFVGQGNAGEEDQDDSCTDDFSQHTFSLTRQPVP